jgi:hypothetical protein
LANVHHKVKKVEVILKMRISVFEPWQSLLQSRLPHLNQDHPLHTSLKISMSVNRMNSKCLVTEQRRNIWRKGPFCPNELIIPEEETKRDPTTARGLAV